MFQFNSASKKTITSTLISESRSASIHYFSDVTGIGGENCELRVLFKYNTHVIILLYVIIVCTQ